MSWLHAFIDVPAHQHRATSEFWARVLGWPAGTAWDGHPEMRSFEPPAGSSYVHLQQTDGPSRVHLDLEATDPEATVDRAVALGAEHVASRGTWTTLASPGGLPFCVLEAKEHDAPEPVRFSDGHRARLVQICVDSPSSAHEAEVRFWRGLLGPRWAPSDADDGVRTAAAAGERPTCAGHVMRRRPGW